MHVIFVPFEARMAVQYVISKIKLSVYRSPLSTVVKIDGADRLNCTIGTLKMFIRVV